jgi:single-stranded DNA-binding protein
MAKLAERLVEGTLVYVQGELNTRDRERTIKIPNGNTFLEAVVKQIEVEVKADVIRILDRRSSSDGDDAESETEAA